MNSRITLSLQAKEGNPRNSEGSFITLKDERILFAYSRYRDKDDGKTWQAAVDIETDPGRGFCYTAIHFTDDAVLLAYCCGGGQSAVLQDCCIRRIEWNELPDVRALHGNMNGRDV